MLLCAAVLFCTCSLGAFADTDMLSPEDGVVSDDGSNAPLTPDAGTVQGSDGNGILDDASDMIDSASKGVSDAVSDMLGGADTVDNTGTGSVSAADTDTAEDEGGSMAAAIIIVIIIVIAIIVLVIILIPKRRR